MIETLCEQVCDFIVWVHSVGSRIDAVGVQYLGDTHYFYIKSGWADCGAALMPLFVGFLLFSATTERMRAIILSPVQEKFEKINAEYIAIYTSRNNIKHRKLKVRDIWILKRIRIFKAKKEAAQDFYIGNASKIIDRSRIYCYLWFMLSIWLCTP